MRPEDLHRRLAEAPPAGLFVIAATDADAYDPHVADACLHAVATAALPPAERAAGVLAFDGDEFDLAGFLGACRTVPMFAPASVVVCRRTEKLGVEAQAALAETLADLPDTTVVVLLAVKLDGRLKFTKFLKREAQWVEIDAPQDPATLGAWVVRRFADLHKTIDERLAFELARKVGRLGPLAQQVEQIALYVGERPEVTREAVEALWRAQPTDNIFAITDAIGARDGAAALTALAEAERAGTHHLQVLALIETALRRLVGVRRGMDAGLSNEAIAKGLGMKPGAVYYQRQRAEGWSAAALLQLHRAVLDVEYQTKSGGGDPRRRLEAFLVEACR